MKIVYSYEKTFAPREDSEIYGLSLELMQEIREKHPEFTTLWWSWTAERYVNGLARVRIVVSDQDAPDYYENMKIAAAILIIGLILFWIAISS